MREISSAREPSCEISLTLCLKDRGRVTEREHKGNKGRGEKRGEEKREGRGNKRKIDN